jgi:hypothetical protein
MILVLAMVVFQVAGLGVPAIAFYVLLLFGSLMLAKPTGESFCDVLAYVFRRLYLVIGILVPGKAVPEHVLNDPGFNFRGNGQCCGDCRLSDSRSRSPG